MKVLFDGFTDVFVKDVLFCKCSGNFLIRLRFGKLTKI